MVLGCDFRLLEVASPFGWERGEIAASGVCPIVYLVDRHRPRAADMLCLFDRPLGILQSTGAKKHANLRGLVKCEAASLGELIRGGLTGVG